jgi:hypothetical protein
MFCIASRREQLPLAPNSSGALAVTFIVAEKAGEARKRMRAKAVIS